MERTGDTAAGRGTRVHVRIVPRSGWRVIAFRELWAYRELFWILGLRDVKVRYKQTVLGVAWALLQPLATMAVFSLLFGRLAHLPSNGIPYPLFAFCGLLPWQLFAGGLNQAGNSLLANQGLVSKVYFPRVVVPAAALVSPLLDFAIQFVVLVVLAAWYGVAPGWPLLALPFFLLLATCSALGIGLWLSALSVEFRDVRHVIPFLTQFWFFATPVVYPASLVPERWRPLLGLNPVAGVVEGFRWSLLGSSIDVPLIATSTIVAVVLVASGLVYFARTEQTFADVI